MAATQTTAPAVEPITLAEAKAFLRLDQDTDDSFVASLVTTSRLQIEAALDLALITQQWIVSSSPDPAGVIAIPVHPVQSIDAVSLIDASGGVTAIDPESISQIRSGTRSSLLVPAPPGAVVEVALTAGFGDAGSDVPAPIRQALLLLVAHWYENRDPALLGLGRATLPAAISGLLAPYREVRL